MHPKTLWLAILFLALISVSIEAQTPIKHKKSDAKIVVALSAVLDSQRDAWNRGDIEGFMDADRS